jgi:tetratricopeptide (TPR) repeat protein
MKANLAVIALWALPFLAISQPRGGKAAERHVDSLVQLARELTNQEDYDQALRVIEAAEQIARQRLGRHSLAYASACSNHARVYDFRGDAAEARRRYALAVPVWVKVGQDTHRYYRATLMNLALLHYADGQLPDAEKYYLRALSANEKAGDSGQTHLAISLDGLAAVLQDMGRYDEAELRYREALAVFAKATGTEDADYASTLNNLGTLLMETGRYEEAGLHYLEAKRIFELTTGRDNDHFATLLNNLANLYWQLGRYERAEELYLEARDLVLSLAGPDSEEYARSLNNLAALYFDIGIYGQAETNYLQSIAITEQTAGASSIAYAERLGNLATVYQRTGRMQDAQKHYLEALTIQGNTAGKGSPEYLSTLSNLAELYRKTRDFEKSLSLNLEALAVREKLKGTDHPDYANTLHNLADLYLDMGDFRQAEQYFRQVLAISEKSLGKASLLRIYSLRDLAAVYHSSGDFAKAYPLLEELSSLERQFTTQASFHLSEKEMLAHLATFSQCQSQLLTYALQDSSRHVQLSPISYDNALFQKGFLLHAALRLGRLAQQDSQSYDKYLRLKACQRLLADAYSKPAGLRGQITGLEAMANDLEKDLARTVPGFREATSQVRWQDVQRRLQPGEVTVEFVDFPLYKSSPSGKKLYAALVLHPGAEAPRFIPLFEENSLDSLLLRGERKADYVARLYSIDTRGIKPLGRAPKTLYHLIWQPLEQEMSGVQTVYFSPSGLLHRLNLAAIPLYSAEGKTDSILAHRHRFVELGSTRQLLDLDGSVPTSAPGHDAAGKDAVLYGGIKFDADPTATMIASSASNGLPLEPVTALLFSYVDTSQRGGEFWPYISSTQKEVTTIGQILRKWNINTSLYSGYEATEESLKMVYGVGSGGRSPHILHLATHGYFYPDKPTPALPKREGSPNFTSLGGDHESEAAFKYSDQPLIRSGLLLAGANHAWQTGKPLRPDMEDGILTAYEISQMNLAGTELVVLSACETGLGDILGNEGVYGLQRAFKIAGAKYLIISLWEVKDDPTRQFMVAFYSHWMEEKMSIPDAFRHTQLEMQAEMLSPYYWAGFVLVE